MLSLTSQLDPAEPLSGLQHAPMGSLRPSTRLERLRLLVIDDEAGIRDLLACYLEQDGHYVQKASSGEEGVALFTAGEWDAVLIDGFLTGIPGDEVASAIRARSSRVGILIVSGLIDAIRELPGSKCADVFVRKPFTKEMIITGIERAVSTRKMA